jgi:hypothetical protein
VLWRHRRTGIRHRRRRHRGGSHWRRRRRARTRQRRSAWVRARTVRCQSRSAGVRTRHTHGVPTGWTLRPNGSRKRERGDHRHTGQEMMFHLCNPLLRSSVGHGQAIRVAAVRSKSSSPPSDDIPSGFSEPAALIDCWPPRPCDSGPSQAREFLPIELVAWSFASELACATWRVINDKARGYVPQ